MKPSLKLICSLIIIVVALRVGRGLLPLFAPFLPALAAAILLEPLVGGLCRRGVKRSLASAIVTAAAMGLCLAGVVFCAVGGTRLVTATAKRTPELLIFLSDTAATMEQALEGVLRSVPQDAAALLHTITDSMTERLSELPVWASARALSAVSSIAKTSPEGLLFVCTAVIGVYFFSLYLHDVWDFIRRQLSEASLQRLTLMGQVLRNAVGGYVKVQCILSGVTFLILLAALYLMGIRSPIPAAAAIAVIDALPILGAGAVLLPWAIGAMLLGKAARAVGLLAIYAILLVVHNVLQAKLMGSSLGLHPLMALVSLYAGWQLGGLWGMLGLPILCVVAASLNKAEIIKLYK